MVGWWGGHDRARGWRRGGALATPLVALATVAALLTPATPAVAAPAGQLAAWGEGGRGQLGTGTGVGSTAAVTVTTTGALAGRSIAQIAAGGAHACAVTSDGLLACWGDNSIGQLGTGATEADSLVPVAVTGGALTGKKVVQVSAGTDHTCALTSDAVLACWGGNGQGQLGTGTRRSVRTPVLVATDTALKGRKVTAVSAGSYATCAVASGAAVCWGLNTYGGLGDGTTLNRTTPVAVRAAGGSALAGRTVTAVTAGVGHACARTSVGGLACWGWNGKGQLGIATTAICQGQPCSTVPVGVASGGGAGQGVLAGRKVAQVSAGNQATCAAATDGSASCWGWNGAGQLGTGDTVNRPAPAPVSTGPDSALRGKRVTMVSTSAVASSTGPGSACARASDGTVACWGNATGGGVGADTDTRCAGLACFPEPFAVTGAPGSGVLAGGSAVAVAVGQHFAVALTPGVAVTSPSDGSSISSGGYFAVRFTTAAVPVGSTAYLTLNGRAKARLVLAKGTAPVFPRIPAEIGTYAVRIGGGAEDVPVLARSPGFRLTIVPFQLDGSTVSGSRRTFRVLTGNFADGTTITLTRNGRAAATRRMPPGSAGKPGSTTITVDDRPGTYQVRVDSRQGFVYGAASGVIRVP